MKKKENQLAWRRRDTYSLIGILLGICLLSVLTYFLPPYIMDRKMNNYEGKTQGSVLSIIDNEWLEQNMDGEKISVYSHTVIYYYSVDGKQYTNTNRIGTVGKYSEFVSKVRNSNFTQEIIVKYNVENPQESVILIE